VNECAFVLLRCWTCGYRSPNVKSPVSHADCGAFRNLEPASSRSLAKGPMNQIDDPVKPCRTEYKASFIW